jgi:hypothetical protein
MSGGKRISPAILLFEFADADDESSTSIDEFPGNILLIYIIIKICCAINKI